MPEAKQHSLPWWIWSGEASHYNQTVLAQKKFHLPLGLSHPGISRAHLKITADSWYRLWVNGAWVNDGPCRSWPEHFQYDEIDLTPYLQAGENELRILARYWGTGTFHTCPQRGGLLAQLDYRSGRQAKISIVTGPDWLVSEVPAFWWNTPKASIQMEPQEFYDARLEDHRDFKPACLLFPAGSGPWQDLHPRDVPLLGRQPASFKTFTGVSLVQRRQDWHYCLPAARLNHPGLVEANRNVSQPGGVCALAVLEKPATLEFAEAGMRLFVDGQHASRGRHRLGAGTHLLLALVSAPTGHDKEKTFRIKRPPKGLRLVNPLAETYPNPWCWLSFPEFRFAGDDLRWPEHGLEAENARKIAAYEQLIASLGASVTDQASFRAVLAPRALNLPESELFARDTHWRFTERQVKAGRSQPGTGRALVLNPASLMYDHAQVTTLKPSASGDLELGYDLGQQVIGYYDFELVAEAGVELDIYSVEYITPQGVIQHTLGNRNGMTYVTREGLNRFTSTKCRSGRYVFITFRNQRRPLTIRKFQVIESTYPVNATGSFACSDARLERIFEISALTLKLCMEDTFTDCPLYEQTLWVGDARNESVFAYDLFGAVDMGKRCIRLAAQSLERYPIAGCQVPSGWDCLLPAWSFLWGISVWDYYAFTADREFLAEIWPAVIQNLEGAASMLDEHGLFSGPFWNMFDWSGIDDRHATVLHNSMLLVGAVNAALRCAGVLEDHPRQGWLASLRAALCASLNRFWSDEKQAYPDSLLEDGRISPSTSQHTSFLALLYDIVTEQNRAAALENMLNPPEKMVRVGSPFAILYFYEALEKEGQLERIIASIYEAYLPMLEAGATTVWETFPSSNVRPGQFPTRSHCHAWSSAPLHFLPRLVLGIRSAAPGGVSYEVSPRLSGLSWARGSLTAARGPLEVEWKVAGSHLLVKIGAPHGTQVKFIENETHQGLEVHVELIEKRQSKTR